MEEDSALTNLRFRTTIAGMPWRSKFSEFVVQV